MSKRRNIPQKKSRSLLDWISLIIMMIPLAIIPLIMFEYPYDPDYGHHAWFPENAFHSDFFLYYKQIVFVLTAIAMLVLIIIRALQDRKKITWIPAFIPLGIYALLCILSTVFSKYRSYGLNGAFEHFETLLVLLSYAMTVYYAFLFIKRESDLHIILAVFSVGIFVITALGTGQAFGKDLFSTEFGKKLFISEANWPFLDNYKIVFEEGRTFMTLYNPNYVGVYTSLVIPISFLLMLYAKPWFLRILNGINCILSLLCLFGAESKAGILGLAVIILLLILFLRRRILLTFVMVGTVILALIVLKETPVVQRLIESLNTTQPVYELESIETGDKDVAITFKGNTLHLQMFVEKGETPVYRFTDDKGIELAHTVSEDRGTYVITDERFLNFTFYTGYEGEVPFVRISLGGYTWDFTNQTEDGTYYFYNNYRRLDKIIIPEEGSIFADQERFASGRGYLWSRSLPVMLDHILLGTGADSFAQVYPQQDYVGRVRHGMLDSTITKPHSMYLQIGVQTGMLSLFAFLAFYLMYAFQCFKFYIGGRLETFAAQAGVGLFIGTVGFMILGISNDSMVVTSPVFYGILGLGFAANAMVKKQRAEANAPTVSTLKTENPAPVAKSKNSKNTQKRHKKK